MTLFGSDKYVLRPYQQKAVDAALRFLKGPGKNNGIEVLPTGCHAKGTGILMADGTVKNVEDITVGELVMGPDGEARRVLELCRVREMMYQITPRRGGKPFVVNGNHVLSLVSTNEGKKAVCPSHQKGGERQFITVESWIAKSKSWKHLRKLHRAPLLPLGNINDLPVPPWVLGVILGDGTVLNGVVAITSADAEIISGVREFAKAWGLGLRESPKSKTHAITLSFTKANHKRHRLQPNSVVTAIRSMGLAGQKAGHKFIPHSYKIASAENRRELLAGLIDTDGHYSKGGYDFVTKSSVLASDVAFIARSLGLSVNESVQFKSCQTGAGGFFSRLSISGNIDTIPCRVDRKKASERRQKKDHLRTGFTVEVIGEDDFYGFTLDRDHLYLTSDFFVHHNSGKSLVFIGLNPSTADAKRDDPTVRRCIRFAQALGFGGMVMLNLFAYRATLPSEMKQVEDPTGGLEHDRYLMKYADGNHTVVAAWGIHGRYRGRDRQVLQMFGKVYCLGVTKEGFPRHPLYLKKDCTLKEYVCK